MNDRIMIVPRDVAGDVRMIAERESISDALALRRLVRWAVSKYWRARGRRSPRRRQPTGELWNYFQRRMNHELWKFSRMRRWPPKLASGYRLSLRLP